MALYKTTTKLTVYKLSQKISTIPSQRESIWIEKQKERAELKIKQAIKAKDYTKKLLQRCK